MVLKNRFALKETDSNRWSQIPRQFVVTTPPSLPEKPLISIKKAYMRKLILPVYMTMDGIVQAPGGPQEDSTNNFGWGGWMFPFSDPMLDEKLAALAAEPYDLLLGRRTYEIFAAYWPYQVNHPMADLFNRIEKYVVATTAVDTSWENSTLISHHVVEKIQELKAQEKPNLLVWGSRQLVQTLFRHHLVDVLQIWTCPLTLGRGKKLFEEGTQPQNWKLMDSVVSTTGVIVATYVPNGPVQAGSFASEQVSEKERLRRQKLANEGG
ncbi:dihydrofolate reductase family protein [Larkinella insperata]|uniref:Dihydrofolate reductase family protein n=1 Tax=Larkinella insperata TaxID=332158 RepID=A0ABW3QEU8_9BACT